jgi:GNAT superfamily N-acetyltransferase
MENNSADYLITKGIADDAELENYRQCFIKNGTERDLRNLQWLHQQNLAATHSIYYAMQDNKVAAIYTAMPVVFLINGTRQKALQSIDTITDVDHRGKGLFPKLAARLYKDAEAAGFELVYGFPNENSAPGFFKKLQWIPFGEAPFLLKPLSLGYFFRKLLGRKSQDALADEQHVYKLPATKQVQKNTIISELATFDSAYDTLWMQVAAGISIAVDRSSGYMNWRYVTKPGANYSRCGIFENGHLKGIIVFTIKNKHNGRIGYIMELVYDPQRIDIGRQLLRYAAQICRQEGSDTMLAWCFPHSFNYKCFRAAGFFDLPVKLRPQHLFLGVRPFNQNNKELIAEKTNWYISYSDSDTV